MDPGILIPVSGYGGIERLIDLYAQEYKRQGHQVELLITAGSKVDGCLVHPFGKPGFPPKKADALLAIPKAWKFLLSNHERFDLIHSFGRLAYLIPVLNRSVKKMMTYQREITARNINYINRLPHKNLFFTGCSADLLSRGQLSGNWSAIHNGIDFSVYTGTINLSDKALLIFLGRIERIKGCHTAIAVAKATGSKLVIAGNISSLPEEIAYFEETIKPQIDGKQIKYIGQVNDVQKNEWLGKSKALLMPIEWNEPFGIVMIEAMACGTPVIAFTLGSVAEVVEEGVTGFKVTNENEMIAAVKHLETFDRAACRLRAAERFDVKIIAKQYLDFVSA